MYLVWFVHCHNEAEDGGNGGVCPSCLRRARQLGNANHFDNTLGYDRALLGAYDEFNAPNEALAAGGSSSTALATRSKLLERAKVLDKARGGGLAHRRVRDQPPAEVF